MKTHYQDLEDQVAYWRWRAEEAEAKLSEQRKGFRHIVPVKGLTPMQTVIITALAERDLSSHELQKLLESADMATTQRSLNVQLCLMRKKLPEHLAPSRVYGWGGRYQIPNRDALKAFLADEERAAA
jgi:hypothetical protein